MRASFPALMLAVAIMATAYIVARKRGYQAEPFPGFKAILVNLVAAVRQGCCSLASSSSASRAAIFTAIESATVAVLYALLVTVLVYRKLNLKDFLHADFRRRAVDGTHPVRDRGGGRVWLADGLPPGAGAGGRGDAIDRA